MAKRVKITLPEIETKEIEFLDKKVKVNKYIDMSQYETISNDIRENVLYNNEVTDKYAILWLRYIKDVLDLCTNIDTSDLTADNLNANEIYTLLYNNIENFSDINKWLDKEYDKYVLENSLGALGNRLPSTEEMEKSMENISKTINELPEDKLELIAKSIAWNNSPVLGSQVAPVEHIEPAGNSTNNVVELPTEK